MSADWDLLATFFLPVVIASVALWNRLALDQRVKRSLLIMMAGITFLHTLAFILVNADTDRAISRFSDLQDLRLWAPHACAGASEGLGIYYREHGNYQRALECYQRYIEFDSTNSRVWNRIAYAHQLMGDHEGELASEEKALQYGDSSWQMYLNLGSLYGARGENEKAIAMNRKVLELHPGSAIACNNLGFALIKRNKAYLEALPYFLEAIAIDSTYATAYLNAGLCNFILGRTKEMRFYYESYLQLRPDAPERGTILSRMAVPP
jgi:tetratricopeptide (TPR) repeat protein